ncbi:hypothetical protein FOCC_FOCC003684 [Frankliniella occidentalis]|uniref:Pleckstrin homology domain-containing family J member 1 n=1 Tax=Frankliniella occidentalis TaxID=133901 RepID=A0A6J1SC62_FRAOC|nr:sesquipedalian-1 [Frankliniella occidentalis]KAE8749696.1 hypothetical protein FOCC_FOCC003684 [Frankliniella occidentalis]
MRFNEREASEILANGTIDLEGRLNFRKICIGNYSQPAFKERWFKLKGNLLFYFRINEIGKVDGKQPTGLLILENCSVQPEGNSGVPFAFSLSFRDEPDKKLIFAGRSEDHVQQWINALKQSSYEYWRQQMILLQSKICFRTGKDPLLLYPHNQGVVRNFQEPDEADQIGMREPSFQSHILVASTAAISIHTAPTPTPLARSASSTSAVLRSIVPPPRTNALSRSASSSQANKSPPLPPRASRSQFHHPVSPLAQTQAPSVIKLPTHTQSSGCVIDESPNLIEL